MRPRGKAECCVVMRTGNGHMFNVCSYEQDARGMKPDEVWFFGRPRTDGDKHLINSVRHGIAHLDQSKVHFIE